MNGGMLQNPSDPDATFRSKAGKNHKECSANIVESVGEDGSIVTDYALEQNIHSDSDFTKETIAGMGKQDDTVIIVADGAFGGGENIALAKENNIALVATNLTRKASNDINADFEFNAADTAVVRCPAGMNQRAAATIRRVASV